MLCGMQLTTPNIVGVLVKSLNAVGPWFDCGIYLEFRFETPLRHCFQNVTVSLWCALWKQNSSYSTLTKFRYKCTSVLFVGLLFGFVTNGHFISILCYFKKRIVLLITG